MLILELFNYNDTVLDFCRFAFMVAAVTHWLACGWRALAGDYRNDTHVNWVTETRYDDRSNSGLLDANRAKGIRVGHQLTRPPNPRNTILACVKGNAYAASVWALSFVRGPFSVAPCTNPTRLTTKSLYGRCRPS